jgi:isopenicillin N synthase-like dioxygenase
MKEFRTMKYHYKTNSEEKKLLKFLCRISKNVYNTALYELRQQFKALCADYDRQQAQHQQEISTIMQAQHEQTEEETAKTIEQATASIRQDFELFKAQAREAGNNLLRLLASDPDEQDQEYKRLKKRLRQAGIDHGPAQVQLIAYYLAPLFSDTD